MLLQCNHLSQSTKLFSIFGKKTLCAVIDPTLNVKKQIIWKTYCVSSKSTSTLANLSSRHYTMPSFFLKNFTKRLHSKTKEQTLAMKNKTSFYYLSAFTILVTGFTYSSVLLYRLYCQTTGKGGKAVMEEASEKIANMVPVKQRLITVNFNADVNSTIKWNFKPQQHNIKVLPGETALAFYTAKNPSNKAISGVATYNVLPFEAGKYLNKIQCFCFEEQQLNPNEEVDLPVFFYLDPEFAEDPFLEHIHEIYLSYCFFEAKEGFELPLPAFMK